MSTSDAHHRLMPPPRGGGGTGIIISTLLVIDVSVRSSHSCTCIIEIDKKYQTFLLSLLVSSP